MTRTSIKEIFKYGKEIELVMPGEGALMPDFHRRHTIAVVRDALGLAQAEADNGYVEGVRRKILRLNYGLAVREMKFFIASSD